VSDQRFPREERLKLRNRISELFAQGKRFQQGPISVLWMVSPWPLERGVQVMVGAPKRRFKHAVDRNRIKRLLRESYRLERADHFKSSPPLLLAFLYQGDDRVALNELQRHMSSALSKIAEKAIH
jgi:ribonuclease P protein component